MGVLLYVRVLLSAFCGPLLRRGAWRLTRENTMFGSPFSSPQPKASSCPACGTVMFGQGTHVCNKDTVARYQARILMADIASWFTTNEGRFELWYAEHRRVK